MKQVSHLGRIDDWTSKAKKPYIALTLHYLNSEYVLFKISMGIIVADYNHDAINLKDHSYKLYFQVVEFWIK